MESFSEIADKFAKMLEKYFRFSGDILIAELLSRSNASMEYLDSDGWAPVDICDYVLKLPAELYSNISDEKQTYEKKILKKLEPLNRELPNASIAKVVIMPIIDEHDKGAKKPFSISNKELLHLLESQKNLMISVSTGGLK